MGGTSLNGLLSSPLVPIAGVLAAVGVMLLLMKLRRRAVCCCRSWWWC